MTDQVKGLRFDIYERIDLPEGVEGIEEWEEIELTPNIQLSTTDTQAILHGQLMLTGVYVGENTRHNNRLEHAIPVEITLPLKRIANIDQVSVEIDNFDIELLSARRMSVNGVLSLGGVATENIDIQDNTRSERSQSFEPSFVSSGDDKFGGAKMSEPLLSDMMRKEKATKEKAARRRSEDKAVSQSTEASNLDEAVQDVAANRLREQAKRDLLTSSLQEGISRSEPAQAANIPESTIYETRDNNVAEAHDHESMPSAQPQFMDQMTVGPETTYTSSLTGHDADVRDADERDEDVRDEDVRDEDARDADERDADERDEDARDEDVRDEDARDEDARDAAARDSDAQLETANISSAEAFTQQTDHASTDQLFSDNFDSFETGDNTEEQSKGIKIAFSSHKSAGESSLEASDLQQQLAMHRNEGQVAEQVDADASEAEASDSDDTRLEAEQNDTPSTEWKSFLLNRGSAEEKHFSKVRMCIVQKEDTLDSIADRYQLNPREIILYNRLGDQELNEGQIVYIPNLSS